MTTFTRLLLLLILVMAACADPDAVSTTPPADEDNSAGASADAEIDPVPGNDIEDVEGPEAATGDPEPVPMPVEPDGGIGDGAGPPASLDEPPAFGVSSETDSLSIDPVSWCWTDSEGMGVCADGAPPSPLPSVSGAAQLVITFAEGDLRVMTDFDTPDESVLPVVQENPGVFLVDISALETGEHELSLGWRGEQGSASAYVSLTITR